MPAWTMVSSLALGQRTRRADRRLHLKRYQHPGPPVRHPELPSIIVKYWRYGVVWSPLPVAPAMQTPPPPGRDVPMQPERFASALRRRTLPSAGQMLDGGDTAEAVAELLQQGESVGTQLCIFGIDHHPVEERVDLGA